MNLRGKLFRSSVIIFYVLIGLEIIIMISPFAAYFYAGYGPVLNTLYAFPATAWLTGFFLPHAVVSKSELLNFINSFGRTLFSLGIIAFLAGALQIYTAGLFPADLAQRQLRCFQRSAGFHGQAFAAIACGCRYPHAPSAEYRQNNTAKLLGPDAHACVLIIPLLKIAFSGL